MTVSVVSLLVPEEVMFSLFVPEELTFSLISLLAESAPEAAAVGPRGDQAVVGGGGLLKNPLCPVGFDLIFRLLRTNFSSSHRALRQLSNLVVIVIIYCTCTVQF